MALVSMKRLPDKTKADGDCCAVGCDDSLYPYGLQISLCDEDLQKLGISADSLTVGQILTITAQAEVTSIGIRKEQDGTESNASLQITDLDLNLPTSATRLQAMYSNSKMKP